MSSVYLNIWGVKQELHSLFCHPGMEDEHSFLYNESMEDIRSQVKFQSVDLDFYSIAWLGDYEIYSAYSALYDWLNRKNGYIAVSLFVPVGQRVVGGPAALLDRLMGMYKDQYIGADWKIKNIEEDPEPFLQVVGSTWVKEEVRPLRSGEQNKSGVVRYSPGLAGKYLSNPYREEFNGFERVFFLPEGQKRLSTAPTVQQIKLLGYGTEMTRPITFPVIVKPKLEGSIHLDVGNITVQINGLTVRPDKNGTFIREFLDNSEMVSVLVASDGYLPVVESKSVKEWNNNGGALELKRVPRILSKSKNINGGKEESNGSTSPPAAPLIRKAARTKLARGVNPQEKTERVAPPYSSTIWAKTNKQINGPFSLKIYLKENKTNAPVNTEDQLVRLTITSLGGTFYSLTPVINMTGLSVNDRLEGVIELDGYRAGMLNYTVRSEADSASAFLEPVTVLLDKVNTPVGMARVSVAESRRAEQRSITDMRSTKRVKPAKWVKVAIVGLMAGLIFITTHLFYDSYIGNGAAIREEDRTALKEEFTRKYNLYLDTIGNIIDQEKQALEEYDEEVAAAVKESVNPSVTQPAADFSVEVGKFLSQFKNSFDDPRDLGEMSIDTSLVTLPLSGDLETLLKRPLLELRRSLAIKRKQLQQYKKNIAIAIKEQKKIEEKKRNQEKIIKRNTEEATSIADAAKLYPTSVYKKYIQWTDLKNTSQTHFSRRDERKRVHEKLTLLREIAVLEYNARSNFDGNVIRWLIKLKEKSNHSSLNSKQRQMLKQKVKMIMSSSALK